MTLRASLWNGLSTVVDFVRYATQPDPSSFPPLSAQDSVAAAMPTAPEPYSPVIYGIFHDGSQDVAFSMLGRIEDARARGAASIGLELTPSILSDPGLTNAFKPFAAKALDLGMTVIPLEDDTEFEETIPIQMALSAVSAAGGFDAEMIEARIRRLGTRLQTLQERELYLSPEEIRRLCRTQLDLSRLKRAGALIQSLDGDFDRFSEVWEQAVSLKRTESMESRLRASRPDMGIVGFDHAFRFDKELGYRTVDARIPYRLRHDIHRFPNLYRLLCDYGSPRTGRAVYEHLREMILKARPEQAELDLDVMIDRACQLEPALFELILRIHFGVDERCTQSLTPVRGAPYFKMSVRDVENRVFSMLEKL